MFSRQTEEHNAGGFESAVLQEIARSLSLDVDRFRECTDSERYVELVVGELEAGRSLGVSGTPTVFLNGEQINLTTLDALFEEIESAAELSR